jgi:hypothetical protein
MADGSHDTCQYPKDRHAITDTLVVTTRGMTPVVFAHPGDVVHFHGPVFAGREFLTWRGFIGWKTKRLRYIIRHPIREARASHRLRKAAARG